MVGLCLPCVFDAASMLIDDAVRRFKPVLTIALGLASQRSAISVERVALNLAHATIADNSGALPSDLPLIRGAPLARATGLAAKEIVAALRADGLPAEQSFHAGTYVCNAVFYRLMHGAARRRGGQEMAAGFIHLPRLPESGAPGEDSAGLSLADQIRAVRLAVSVQLALPSRQVNAAA